MEKPKDESMSKQGEKVESKVVVAADKAATNILKQETKAEVAIKIKEKDLPSVPSKEDLQALDYVDFSTPARMLAIGEVLVRSKLVPLKTKEDVFAALQLGQDLGLPFITSVTQIYPINGRPTLGTHILKALCLKNGVVFTKVEDAVDIFMFAEANENGETVIVNEEPVIVSQGTAEEQPANTTKMKVDVRTTYEGTRALRLEDGSFQKVTARGSFTMGEAREAELLGNDVWVKYWRRMLDARAFKNMTSEIASDIVLGIYTPNELSNDFYINGEGQEVPHTIDVTAN